jgi:hypothetical protein
MTDQHTHHEKQRLAVYDYLTEHAARFPHHAGTIGTLSDRVYRQALLSIPDEFHAKAATPSERFIKSVIAEAQHLGRDPYHVAEFALDLVA